MNLEPLNISALLGRAGLKPDKRLGQNFLVDNFALQQVVDAAEVTAQDMVLEIGAGLGSLTRLLASQARRVIAVELDERLVPLLRKIMSPFSNVNIVQGDIMTLRLADLLEEAAGEQHEMGYLVAANIPYYITSALIRRLLEVDPRPRRVALTVQKEVAERICAAPGDLSLLALGVQVYGAPSIAAHIPAESFFPAPDVDSAVVRVELFDQPAIPYPLLPVFFHLAKAGFSQKRKTLRNALAGGLHWEPSLTGDFLQSAGIDPQRRAETLSIEEWRLLTEMGASDRRLMVKPDQ